MNKEDQPQNKAFNTLKEITSASTLLFYIIYGVIDIFGHYDKLFWIPLVLFSTNFLILMGVAYYVFIKGMKISKPNMRWLIINLIVNLTAVTLSILAITN